VSPSGASCDALRVPIRDRRPSPRNALTCRCERVEPVASTPQQGPGEVVHRELTGVAGWSRCRPPAASRSLRWWCSRTTSPGGGRVPAGRGGPRRARRGGSVGTPAASRPTPTGHIQSEAHSGTSAAHSRSVVCTHPGPARAGCLPLQLRPRCPLTAQSGTPPTAETFPRERSQGLLLDDVPAETLLGDERRLSLRRPTQGDYCIASDRRRRLSRMTATRSRLKKPTP
jgi:hypothetical protein